MDNKDLLLCAIVTISVLFALFAVIYDLLNEKYEKELILSRKELIDKQEAEIQKQNDERWKKFLVEFTKKSGSKED